jgi:Ca2+-transporting ATPase
MAAEKTQFFNLSINETLEKLKTQHKGLSEKEVLERRKKFGPNLLPEAKPKSAWLIFLSQLNSILIYILLIAAGINFALVCQEHERVIFSLKTQVDTYVIILAVVINVIVGYIQERKAQRSLLALKKIININARVVRDHREFMVKAEELVPGDIILISAGDKIPADARLMEAHNLEVNEAALTGESEPVSKVVNKLSGNLEIADRINMVFAGTVATKSEGQAVVVATGAHTEIGNIARMIKETPDEKTPLQEKLNKFSKKMGIIVLVIASILVLVGLLQGDSFMSIFTVSVAVAVSSLPEGLAVGVTVILALGMQRILKQKALVRHLVATETLGSTTVICTDKTGTLTEGKMQVTDLVTWDHDFAVSNIEDRAWRNKENEECLFALHAGMMCNDAKIDNIQDELKDWVISGNLTERALLLAAVQAGLDYNNEHNKYPRLDAIPFDSSIKYMATLHKLDEKNNIVYVKGAPEQVLRRSQHLRIGNRTMPLTTTAVQKFQHKFVVLSQQGLRILAIAYKRVKTEQTTLKSDKLDDLVFIGYIGIKDPLRTTSKETVKLCQQAGVKVVMITGDHKLTAQAIAKDLGLPAKSENILEGSELEKISKTELEEKVKKISVYARVSPEHKLRIVQAWLKKGEVVAMTGDGINDSPALKAANIGVALGSGTQVAKDTADIVLLDDNFKSIVMAVEEGRGIFDNIKKTVLYLISDSFSEVILLIGTIIFNLPLPLTAAQILWINLVNDTLPNLALTKEPKEKEIMDEPPRGRKAEILSKEIKILIVLISGLSGIASLIIFYVYYKLSGDLLLARSVTFALLGADSLIYIFSIRSLRHSLFKYNPLSNKHLLLAVAVSLAFLLLALYWPFLSALVKTRPLDIFDWMIVLMISFAEVFCIELVKYLFLRNKKYV